MDNKIISYYNKVARDTSTNAAVVFNCLLFYITMNENTQKDTFRNGKYWTFISVKAISENIGHLTIKQIRTAIDKLIQGGYIVKDRFNKNHYDRTTWYALGSKGLEIQAELKDNAREQAKPQQKKQPQSHSKKKNSTEQPKRYDNIHDVMLFGEYSSSLDYWDGLTYGEYLQKHHSYLYPQYLAEEEEKKRIQAIEERKATAQTINA